MAVTVPDYIAIVIVAWALFTFTTQVTLLIMNIRKGKELQIKSAEIEDRIKNIWNEKIELKDLNGNVIKVPIQRVVGTLEDGSPKYEVEMVVAPVWYTVMHMAGSMALTHFQMWFNNQKSHLSKKFGKKLLEEGLESEDSELIMMGLPKKMQKTLQTLKAAKTLLEGDGSGLKRRMKAGVEDKSGSRTGEGFHPG